MLRKEMNEKPRVFIDTCVLTSILNKFRKGVNLLLDSEKPQNIRLVDLIKASIPWKLRNNGFECWTSRKCVHELFSIIKGVSKSKGNNALKAYCKDDLNTIMQKIYPTSQGNFRKSQEAFNFSRSDYWLDVPSELDPKEVRDFCKWKRTLLSAFRTIEGDLSFLNIKVCEYYEIYSSNWYKIEGYPLEQYLADNALIPNEDFELVLASIYLGCVMFITNDKKLIPYGGLCTELKPIAPSFVHITRIDEAIEFYKQGIGITVFEELERTDKN